MENLCEFLIAEDDLASLVDDGVEGFDDDLEEVVAAYSITQSREKNEDFISTTEAYDDDDFRTHFRISRQLAHELAVRFKGSPHFSYQEGRDGRLEPYEQILIFLWFAGHEAASFRDVADRFGIAISSLYYVTRLLIHFFSSLSSEIIKWPEEEEKVQIERAFGRMGLPNVIGAVDGSHVRIDRPSEDPDSYFNRKKYHSIHMQVVCDHQCKMRSVFIGFPGSVHDARAFRRSPLAQQLPTLCGEYCILGDSAYPCLRNLITTFKDTGNLTRAQKAFNRLHSKLRIVIEHCFGILKQKFRQLYHCKLRIMKDIVHFIRVCCVLHNLALDDQMPDAPTECEDPQENVTEPDSMEFDGDTDAPGGVAFRNYLVAISTV